MFRDFSSPEQASSNSSPEIIANCIKMLMSLTPMDLSKSATQSGLRALRELTDSLIQRSGMDVRESSDSPQQSFEPKPFQKKVEPKTAVEDLDSGFHENRRWQNRRRTQAEKDQKKARLEKREEILRDLRSRVSEIKSGLQENISLDSETDIIGNSQEKFRFEVRYQSASVWPKGSVEWARELLGVDHRMSVADKRQCYLQMVKECHPDLNKSIPLNAMQLVNAAWELVR